MAKPTTAVSTRKSTAIANVQEQLANEAGSITDRIGAPASSKIKTKDKVFTFPDGTVDQGPINVVIVDFMPRNSFYESKWDANNPAPPVCYAFGTNPKDMKPSEHSTDPQAENCHDCPMNQFGSDGDGKACKNTRMLAVLPPDAGPEDPLMTMDVSATAIRSFDTYVGTVARMQQVPPIGVVSEVTFHPEKSYPSLLFGQPTPNENVGEHLSRRPEALAILTREYEVQDDTGSQAPAKTTRKKAAVRRGTPRKTRR